jgi:hypothetical protein
MAGLIYTGLTAISLLLLTQNLIKDILLVAVSLAAGICMLFAIALFSPEGEKQ